MLSKLLIAILAVAVLAGSAAGVGAETPDEVYAFATHLKKDGLFEAAAQQFLRFARENPTDGRAPEALMGAADCLAQVDNAAQAVTVLETILTTYPGHPDRCRVMVQLGRTYHKLEQFAQADRVFTDAVVSIPDCPLVPEALLGKSEALISMQQYARAAEVLRDLTTRHADSKIAPRATYNLAFCYRQLKRTDEALRAYQTLVSRYAGDPLSGFAALEAARIHAERGETELAIQYYTRARQFGTKTFAVPAGNEAADLLASKGEYDRALTWYEELLARTDLDARNAVYIRAVLTAYDAGKDDAVMRLANAYEEQFPGTYSPQISHTRARSAVRRGKFQDALAEATKLEQFAPGTEWARSAPRIRGDAFMGMNRPQDAVDQWNAFVSVSSDSASRVDVLRKVADVSFEVTHDTTAALDALTRVLDVQLRQNPADLLAIAARHEEVSRFADALRLYDDLIRRFPLSDEAERAETRRAWLVAFTMTDPVGAAKAMERVAVDVAAGRASTTALVQARIEAMKNFEAAAKQCAELRKSIADDRVAQLIYLEGLAYSSIARSLALGLDQRTRPRAKDAAKKAQAAWDELAKRFPSSQAAGSAAFAALEMRADVDGAVDERAAETALSQFPGRVEAAPLLARLGDQYASGDAPAMDRAISYYDRSLNLNNTIDLQLRRALVVLRKGNQRDALTVFESIARRADSRTSLRAALGAGDALRALKQYREAIPHFDRVSGVDPAGRLGYTAALQAADCVYLLQDYESARARYAAAAAGASHDAWRWEASYRVALCDKQLGRFGPALDVMVGLLLEPHGGAQRPHVYETAAEVAERMGDTAARITILEAFVDEFPRGQAANASSRTLVRLYLHNGDAEKARALSETLVRSAPGDDLEPRALLCMSLYRVGKTGEAQKMRDQLVSSLGPDAELVREIGVEAARHEYDAKQYAAAARSIQPFAENCTGAGVCEEARHLYAMSLLAARDLDRGTAVAQRFFRDYPVSELAPTLHIRLGTVLADANRTNESLLHFEEAAQTSKDDAVALLALSNLGVAYQKLSRWRDAENVWAQALSRFPNAESVPEASLNLARCKMEYGDYAGAIDAYDEAIPMLNSEERARAFYWMGQSYEQLGDFQSAVVQYLKVPYLARDSGGMWVVTAQLKAAECYAKMGRKDAARDLYTKVLSAHGASSNWGKLAQRGIDAIDGSAAATDGGGGQ